MFASVPGSPAAKIRCRSAGRVRGFIRTRVLLANWKPEALPQACSDEAADAALAQLVGPGLLEPVRQEMTHADLLAQRIGGCARDAYTVLYLCAGLAVLSAALGAAIHNNPQVVNLLLVAELVMLVVLFLTFRKAHRVNWNRHWLALRFHVEFLRCLPILAALHPDSTHAREARDDDDDGVDHAPAPPHLAALTAHHGKPEDLLVALQAEQQRATRGQLYRAMQARFVEQPELYIAGALSYADLLARQQMRYHCLRAQQEQAIVHRVHTLSMVAFVMTIVAVLAHFVWHAPLLTVLTTGLPAFAASLHGFVAQEESERLATRFGAMAKRLQGWLDAGREGGHDMEPARGHLGELVGLMMADVQDWHRLFGAKGMYHLG